MNRKILLVIACIITSTGLFAQSGYLTGKITDQETGDPVPFTSVQLFRDGKTGPETAADIDGKYKLEKISPGSYTVKVKVVGYDSLTISDVTINANSKLTMNLEVSSKRDQYYRFMPIPNYYPKKNTPAICPYTPPDLKALPERKVQLGYNFKKKPVRRGIGLLEPPF